MDQVFEDSCSDGSVEQVETSELENPTPANVKGLETVSEEDQSYQ